jgi:class 3 adenylate cyclase
MTRPSTGDPGLDHVAEQVARSGWAAMICDPDYRLVWVSDELKALIGEQDERKLGIGEHIVTAWLSETWSSKVTLESELRSFMEAGPYLLARAGGGREELKRLAPQLSDLIDQLEPAEPPPVHVTFFDFLHGDLPPVKVVSIMARLTDSNGRHVGGLVIYGSALPATVLTLVARGDEGMFARMARLIEPGRRQSALLFADLQTSGALSRRLPSAAYFKLVRAIITSVDEVVVRHTGIVGKHAGDGVTAFFLADDLGSSSGAARAAIETARHLSIAAHDEAKAVAEETGLVEPEECLINVGLHWGDHLYMGQLVSGGRLEITALGDRVNECARIEQSARDGQILASKSLIEALEEEDARALGLDPDRMTYRMVAELPGADEKAARDAGMIPVTEL